jgi:putative ABC transport system permease protein
MRIPMVRGRGFDDRDLPGSARVAIVNETLAARTWPNDAAIGRRVFVHGTGREPWTVVGVARDNKYFAVFEAPQPHIYLPQTQNDTFLRTIEVRSTQAPEALAARVQQEIAALDADLPTADLRPFRQTLAGNIGFLVFRVGALQATMMGVLGLILAVVGMYGVVSYRTSQRAREIGIRVALGAEPGDVRRLVLGQGAWLVVGGIGLGLAVTVGLTQLAKRIVPLVNATDPATFLGVTSALALVALVACYLPARRAMRVEPIEVLRHE